MSTENLEMQSSNDTRNKNLPNLAAGLRKKLNPNREKSNWIEEIPAHKYCRKIEHTLYTNIIITTTTTTLRRKDIFHQNAS